MLSLAEFQFTMAADLLDGGMRTARLLPGDPAMVMAALQVHRNTVLTGLARALRLTYPTVAWLTGEDFFDQGAFGFASANPPRGACLSDYGDGFAEFLESYRPAAGLAYLADAARFDLAIERCANASPFLSPRIAALDCDTAIELDGSLITLTTEYPVDQLRDACDGKGLSALEHLDMSACARSFAIWRGATGASVRRLSGPASTFLGAMLRGESAEASLATTLLHAEPDEALQAIQTEIFAAPFVRIPTQSQGERT
jgi:hypothetical protein